MTTTDHITNTSIAMGNQSKRNLPPPGKAVGSNAKKAKSDPVAPRGLNNSIPDSSMAADAKHIESTMGAMPSPEPPVAAPAPEKMTRSESASNAANSRWVGEKATEAEVKELFLSLPTDDAIQLLGKMRNNCETAGRAINEAMAARSKGDKCHTCGGEKKPGKQWAFVKAVKHPVTFQAYNIFFCTNACVAAENIKNQGPQGANVIR